MEMLSLVNIFLCRSLVYNTAVFTVMKEYMKFMYLHCRKRFKRKKIPHSYRVFQKFVPIENCFFCKAFDASIGKFKLIQLRNLSRKQFKAISN